ncbi:MAG: hypothetical protein MJZ98_07305 [Paludibacteraceae bacterium]|nr:hypothetical protein [Paludibacteraceae bacterium]
MIPPYYTQRAIPRIESTGVVVNGTTNVRFTFRNHTMLLAPFVGILIVRINQAIPEGTTETLPIVFNSGDNDTNVITYNGEQLTVADFTGTGVYLFFYDAYGRTLQLIQRPATEPAP